MPSTRLSPAHPAWRLTLLALALMPAANSLAAETTAALELPSQAVTATREDETGYSASTASTASKSAVPIMQEAQAVQVVTKQVIEDYQVQSLDDAMKFVSGISQSNTLAGTQDGFVKRGFGSNAAGSIVRDGIRSSVSRNFSATTERVEVLKGPASLLYGALGPGGLINVISKQPEYQRRTQVSGETSSEGGGNLMLDTTGPLGDSGFAYRLIAERQHEDYWRNFGADNHTLIAPSLSWSGDDLRITLAYERKEYSTPVDRGTVIIKGKPANTKYNARFNESWAKAEGTDELFTAKAEYQLNPNWLSRLTYGWNNERYDYAEARPNALNANTGALSRRADGSEHENQTQYLAWDWIGNASVFGQQHDLLLGMDTERVDNFRGDTYRGSAVGGFNIYRPVYGNLAEPSLISTVQSDRSDELHSRSLYIKNNWHLNDQWILVAGGRYQHFEQLVEQGRSYELGIKLDLGNALSASAAVFDIEKENVVVSNNGTSQAAGKVGSQGVEIDISGRIAERWELLGTYAYTDTEILDDPTNQGNELVNAAQNIASLYLTHHLALPSNAGQWRVGGGARYVGERAGDNANSFWLGSHTPADALF